MPGDDRPQVGEPDLLAGLQRVGLASGVCVGVGVALACVVWALASVVAAAGRAVCGRLATVRLQTRPMIMTPVTTPRRMPIVMLPRRAAPDFAMGQQ